MYKQSDQLQSAVINVNICIITYKA